MIQIAPATNEARRNGSSAVDTGVATKKAY